VKFSARATKQFVTLAAVRDEASGAVRKIVRQFTFLVAPRCARWRHHDCQSPANTHSLTPS